MGLIKKKIYLVIHIDNNSSLLIVYNMKYNCIRTVNVNINSRGSKYKTLIYIYIYLIKNICSQGSKYSPYCVSIFLYII